MRFALAFADGLICEPDLMRQFDTAAKPAGERRRRPRAVVSWGVQLHYASAPLRVEGRTSNVSSEGLYCVIHVPFKVGELIDYVLAIPTVDAEHRIDLLRFHGQAEVLRVEAVDGDLYGIACRVCDYKVIPECRPHQSA